MKKRLICATILVLVFMVATVVQGATTLMEIGRSPFHRPPLTSQNELLDMVQAKIDDVKKGFELAGRSDLFGPFMEQIGQTRIEEVQFEKGSTFAWMFYKKKGKGRVKVMRDVTWGNDTPFTGYRFVVEANGVRSTFVVPLGCGNIALQSEEAVPVAVAPPPPVVTPVNQPPKCQMTVSSVRAFCGEIITVDASGSSDDTDIASMKIAFVDDQGQVVSEQVVDGGSLTADVPMACGVNSLKVTLTDSQGLTSPESECVETVRGESRTKLLVDAGYIRQFDPAHHLFGRIGLEYKFSDTFGVLGLIGGAPHIEGYDGKSAFLVDLLGEYSFSRYFIDFGIGGWITDGNDDLKTENSQMDLIAAFGARIYGEPEDFNTSVFLELRSAPDELSDFADYGRFSLGLRFRF